MRVAPGTRLGPYEISKPLGAGGMGEVYEARDTRLERSVAIKVLPAALAKDAGARARFDREARAIAALNHPNICALHDIGDAEGHGFLVMERLEGETLQDRLQRGALEIDQVVDFGIALADALDAAHGRGLIHRDLKPANVFITTRGVIKILDFGLAKSVLDADADITRSVNDGLTTTGTTLGTVAYMSPEQLRAEPLDVRTDLFSLGLVLYEMVTGKRAFGGATIAVAAAGILGQEPPPPRTIRPDVPAPLERAILKTLEKDRELRTQSAADLRDALTAVKRGERIAAPSLSTGQSEVAASPERNAATAPARRQRSPLRLVLFAFFLTAAFAALANWFDPESQRPLPNVSWDASGRPVVTFPIPGEPSTAQNAVPGAAEQQPQKPAGEPEPPAVAPPPRPESVVPPQAESRGRPPRDTPPPPLPPALSVETPVPAPVGPSVNAPAEDAAAAPAGRAGRGRGARGFGPGGATLLKLLRGVPPETYDLAYAANDPEAMAMALQLRAVLSNAGWTNASTAEVAQPQTKLGIFAPQVTSGVAALVSWAKASGLEPDIRRVAALPRPRIVVGRQQP